MHGVSSVDVDIEQDRFTVTYDGSKVQTATMFTAIKSLGYTSTVAESLVNLKTATKKVAIPKKVQELLDQNLPIFLYFGARWCGACKLMERTTFADERVDDMLSIFANLKIDIDDDVNIAENFSISAVPTVLLLSPIGEELHRHVGPLSPEEMVLLLEEYGRE